MSTAPAPCGPLTDAGLRVARERLGLTTEALAGLLGVHERTVRRWETGEAVVPEGVAADVADIRADAEQDVADAVLRLDPDAPVLVLPAVDGDRLPVSWWRAVAGRVAEQVPGVVIQYYDGGER